MKTFKYESQNAKRNAQINLAGLSHYVDDSTLRFHHSRVLASGDTCGGLLFWIITSDAIDMHNTARGFRYVIFDVFGSTVDRTPLDATYKSKEKARAAMYAKLNELDAKAVTLAAIDHNEKCFLREAAEMRERVNAIAGAQ